MNLYIVAIVLFSLVFVVCVFLLIYFIRDEKNLKEVTDRELMSFGKVYGKDEFEERLFNQYVNILESTQYDNYTFLKDAVSDDIYNQILVAINDNQDKGEKNIISDIKKEFSRLVDFRVIGEVEVAKLWVKYSSIEYVKGIRKEPDANGNIVASEVVVRGDKDKTIDYQYVLTFVKNHTQTENVVCPSCGFQTHMLTSSRCLRCEGEIVPKTMHWVLISKVVANIGK